MANHREQEVILAIKKTHTLTSKTSEFKSFGQKTSAKNLSDKYYAVSEKISSYFFKISACIGMILLITFSVRN